jgi:hypothetical protein
MAFIPVADTVLMEIRGTYLSQKVENTLYFEHGGGYDAFDTNALAVDLFTWWNDVLGPEIGSGYTVREIQGTDLSSDAGASVTYLPSSIIQGSKSGDPMPGNVAICVSLRTGGRGRSSRGRNYLSGLTTTEVVGNEIVSSDALAIQAAYNELIAIAAANSFVWVVVSRFHNNAPRAAGVTEPITAAIIVDTHLDSMRRRLTGRGT